MIDENGARLGPGRFLSAALRYQMMPTIDRWVMREAVRVLQPQRRCWPNAPVAFTINFSGQSLGDDGVLDEFVVDQISAAASIRGCSASS